MTFWKWFIKNKKSSFDDFLQSLKEDLNTFHYLRYGQVLMHTLYKHNKEKYIQITNTEKDCFYDNTKVSKTLDYLQQEW